MRQAISAAAPPYASGAGRSLEIRRAFAIVGAAATGIVFCFQTPLQGFQAQAPIFQPWQPPSRS